MTVTNKLAATARIILAALALPGCSTDAPHGLPRDGAAQGGPAGADLSVTARRDAVARQETGACPVPNYPSRSPSCERFLGNAADGLKATLNRTSTCNNPPALGQSAAKCWDDGPTGTERYAGFCINVDGKGVCAIGHLGGAPGSSTLSWDDQLDCIEGEAVKTTGAAKTCLPLCAGQTDQDDGAPCGGGRSCRKTKVEGGERFICGGAR